MSSLLKIWNTNKLSGVLGVFNCQGAGRWPSKDQHKQSLDPSSASISLSGHVSPHDVEYLEDIAGEDWCGDCAVYAFISGKRSLFCEFPFSVCSLFKESQKMLLAGSVSRLSKHERMGVSLGVLKCEIFTISPIRVRFSLNLYSHSSTSLKSAHLTLLISYHFLHRSFLQMYTLPHWV